MKFMMIMIPGIYRGNKKLDPNWTPDPKAMERMGRYNAELGKALKVIDLNGFQPLTEGARVNFAQGKPSVVDGPSIKTNEVFGGYWLLEAKSKEEVLQWAQKCPADDGDTIEVRQIFEL